MMAKASTSAGSDSGSRAGGRADLKTISASGIHGASAVAGITAQNAPAVRAAEPLGLALVAAQFVDLRVGAAAKIRSVAHAAGAAWRTRADSGDEIPHFDQCHRHAHLRNRPNRRHAPARPDRVAGNDLFNSRQGSKRGLSRLTVSFQSFAVASAAGRSDFSPEGIENFHACRFCTFDEIAPGCGLHKQSVEVRMIAAPRFALMKLAGRHLVAANGFARFAISLACQANIFLRHRSLIATLCPGLLANDLHDAVSRQIPLCRPAVPVTRPISERSPK